MVTREFRRTRLFSGTESVNIRELERRNFKLLVIQIDSATRLSKKDVFGLSDPYIRVRFEGVGSDKLMPLTPNSTRTCKRTLSPKWNQTMYFLVAVDLFTVILDVFDENILTKDDHLGRAMVHIDLTGYPDVPGNVVRPRVWDTGGWNPHELHSETVHLRSKYNHEFVTEMQGLTAGYVSDMQAEFTSKSSRGHQKPVSGTVKFAYTFLVPSLPEAVSIMREKCEVSVQGQWHPLQRNPSLQEDTQPRSSLSEQVHTSHPQPNIRQDSTTSSIGLRNLFGEMSLDNQEAPEGWELVPRVSMTMPEQNRDNEVPPNGWEMLSRPRVSSTRTTSYGLEAHEESSDDDEDLPEGWEGRVDSNGRQVFINHVTRTTSLRRPTTRQASTHRPRGYLPRMDSHDVVEVEEDEEAEEEQRVPEQGSGASLESLMSPIPSASVLTTLQPVEENQQSRQQQQQPSASPVESSTPSSGISIAAPVPSKPSPLELKRTKLKEGLPPGWDVAVTPDGRTYYVNHHSKKTTWDRPRMVERKPDQEERGNKSAPVEQDSDLPPGWEMRKAKDGQVYYVDHNTKTTHWEKPGTEASGLGPLPSGWEMKTARDGRIFFLDHKTKSTQWEDPRLQAKNKPTHKMQYSRDYKQKYSNFCQKLNPTIRESQRFIVEVSRTNVMEDSFLAISRAKPTKLRSRLWIEFKGEHGYDYGGLAREWFQLISHEMFNPYYGLFEYSASDDYTLQINPESGTYNEHHLEYFKFIGRVCGMAIYHKKLIDAFFIRPFYKMILDRPITLKDMESVDVELYNSIQYIKENDPEPLCLTFAINKTVYGEVLEEELKPGGTDIPVTEENKAEYIDLLIAWRFTKRVHRQMAAFRHGLSDVFNIVLLRVFDARELEYLLGGLAQIDVEDWKRNTELKGYLPDDQVIIWFWKAIENYDNELRARLLQFVTGTSKVPMNGFAELQGSNGPQKFCIKKFGKTNEFPRAHTCFNRIDLPPYQSYHQLKESLKFAIESTEGFEGVD